MHDVAAGSPSRLLRMVRERLSRRFGPDAPPFAVRLPGSGTWSFGTGSPAATIVVNGQGALAALASFDETRIAEAYRSGALDVEGDIESLLSLRRFFRDRHPIEWARNLLRPFVFGQVASDAAWISEHYDYDVDFYLLFLDRRHRCYSQAVFTSPDEPLEFAQTRKLAYAIDAVGAREGDRVLDIGGGWGAFTEYAGQRGIRVTSLTISQSSERFVQRLIDAQRLPCRVLREHLFEHQPPEKYDAIVNLGVSEHLPDYPRTLAKYERLLKPGGRVYLDASASRARRDLSAFILRYVFSGNGTLLCLHEFLKALSATPFSVLSVLNDRENYRLTARSWAENLDRSRHEIVARWGEPLYRTFRLYLWGAVDGFARDMIQAYRLVLELPDSAS